jgi:hypothetical protein
MRCRFGNDTVGQKELLHEAYESQQCDEGAAVKKRVVWAGFVVAVIVSLLAPVSASAASFVCIDTKGRLIVRSTKCSGKFKPASIANIEARLTLPPGPTGPAGVSGRELKTAQSVNQTIAAQETTTVLAICPASPVKVAVGVSCTSSNESITVISNSIADGFGSVAACTFMNTTLFPISNATLTTTAVCVSSGG